MRTSSNRRLLAGTVLAALLLASSSASAQTTYRWIDAAGRTVVSDLPPPPGARQVVKSTGKNADNDGAAAETASAPSLPYAVRLTSEKFPVVLYTTETCQLCKTAKELLTGRGVPFTEKVVNSEEERAALGRQFGGETLLPSVSIGRQKVRGFSVSAWNEMLDAAGYPTLAGNRPQRTGSVTGQEPY